MSTRPSSSSRSELAALNQLLEEREVSAASRATVLEAVAIAQGSKISVLAQVPEQDGQVALRPAGSSIAAYVHPDNLSLRFDRRRALRTVQEYEFCQIAEGQEPTDEWLHLLIDDWAVEQHAVVVRRLLLSALIIASVQAAKEAAEQAVADAAAASRPVRRTLTRTPRPAKAAPTGNFTNTRPTRAAPPLPPAPPPPPRPAVCPVHFIELVNSRCDYCDD